MNPGQYFPRNFRTVDVDGVTVERRTNTGYRLEYRFAGKGSWMTHKQAVAKYGKRSVSLACAEFEATGATTATGIAACGRTVEVTE
jgi:hypothetical protein